MSGIAYSLCAFVGGGYDDIRELVGGGAFNFESLVSQSTVRIHHTVTLCAFEDWLNRIVCTPAPHAITESLYPDLGFNPVLGFRV